MFQNVLAFRDKFFHKTGKRDRQHPSFKDQSDEQGFNPPDRRLVEDHRQTLPKLRPAGQSHMQGNQKFRSQTEIVQKPIKPLLSFLQFGLGLLGHEVEVAHDGTSALSVARGRSMIALEYQDIFGKENFFIELMDHGLAEQKAVNPQLVAVARKLELPLVATNDIHFARREDAESQDVLVCIQTNRKVSDPDRLKFSTDQFYFKSAAEMTELFKDTPDAIENTGKIAARCTFDFPTKTYNLPQFAPPPGKTLSDYFEEVAWNGFRARMATVIDISEVTRMLLDAIHETGRVTHTSVYMLAEDRPGYRLLDSRGPPGSNGTRSGWPKVRVSR